MRTPGDVTIGHYIALGAVLVLTSVLWAPLLLLALIGAYAMNLLDDYDDIFRS